MKKKVGNAVRTKTQIRSSKSKGSQFEMNVEASMQQMYPQCYRTHDRGYVKQYDLEDKDNQIAIECKRMKSLSWNEAKRYYGKLVRFAPEDYLKYLIFKSNQQPCLVMYSHRNTLVVEEFESFFGFPFIKHTPTKKRSKQ